MRAVALILTAVAGALSVCWLVMNPSLSLGRIAGTLIKMYGRHGVKVGRQPEQYSRVRLKHLDELDKTYHMLIEHLRSASPASSVQEFVLDVPLQERGCCFSSSCEEERDQVAVVKNDSDENLLLQAVKALSLEQKLEDQVTEALVWKKQQLSANNDGLRPDRPRYVSQRDSKYAQYVSPLLLTIFPNLRSLIISETSELLEQFLLKANYGLLPTQHLQKLRDVRYVLNEKVDMYDERFYTRFDILGALKLFHHFPLLESFSVSGIVEEENGITFLPPHISNLKRITITHSDISSNHLSCMIRLSRALEEFTVSNGGRDSWDGSSSIVYPKTLGKALLSQKSSLRSLDLDIDDLIYTTGSGECHEEEENGKGYYEVDEADLEEELSWQRDKYLELDIAASEGPLMPRDLPNTRCYGHTIGSLSDFETLTHLAIGVKLLLGASNKAPFRLVDALPVNLETLIIRGYKAGANPEYTAQINELIEKRADKLPSLREVQGIANEISAVSNHYRMSGYRRSADGRDIEKLWEESEEDDGWLEVRS